MADDQTALRLMRRVASAVVLVTLVAGCGGSGGRANEPEPLPERASTRAVLNGLFPLIEGYVHHFTGVNTDDSTIERDARSLERGVATLREQAATIRDASLRSEVEEAADALARWITAERRARPVIKPLEADWAQDMRVADVFAAAGRQYDEALDAAGAPVKRKNRFTRPKSR